MVSIKRSWSRRDFLRAAGILGSAGALLPILPDLGDARAQSSAPKRLLIVSTGNGTIINRWRQSNFAHGAALPPLTAELLAPLEPFRDRMVLIDGLDMGAAFGDDGNEAPILGHPDPGSGAAGHPANNVLWTGRNGNGQQVSVPGGTTVWPDGPSIDHYIASVISADTPLGAIPLANWRRGDTSFDTGGTQIPNEYEAAAAFSRLFDGAVSDPGAVDRMKERHRRSLDQLRGEIGRLQTQLSGEDRERLDAHLVHFDALEARLENVAACEIPNAPGSVQQQAKVDAMMSMIQQAFACDRTRVINYALISDNDFGPDDVISFIPGVTTQYGGPHALSHASESFQGAAEMHAASCRWQSEQFAALLSLLDAVPEGNGETVLDNTLVVWNQPMSHGGTHQSRGTPAVIVTGKGFATNKYLRFGDYNPTELGKHPQTGSDYPPNAVNGCEPNNRLLVSICHAFGLTDVNEFGDSRFQGALPGLELA